MENPTTPLDREEYLRERDLLIRAELSLAQSFDKYLITLSGGAFGVSIAYLRDLAKPTFSMAYMLYLSWSCLGLTILLMLFALIVGQKAFRRQAQLLGLYQEGKASESSMQNCAAKTTTVLNWVSILSFTVGLVSLAIFSIVNI